MNNTVRFLLFFYCAGLVGSCVSCAGFRTVDIKPIDVEFEEYVDRYKDSKIDSQKKKMRSNITILFHSLPSPTIGICYWMSNGNREVYIDPSFWYSEYTTDKDRELLIFHELGHCDLDRRHNDPSSIMEPYHLGGGEYHRNYGYYVSELFDQSLRKELTGVTSKPAHIKGKSCGGILKEEDKHED